MSTLDLLKSFWNIPEGKSPIEIPNVGRNDFAELLPLLGLNRGVEVGTEEGVFAEILCKANPKIDLTCVDPWEAYVGYREHVTQGVLEGLLEIATDRLAPYNCKLLRKYSAEALADIPDKSLDFVYIDGNHNFLNVSTDLVGWSKKVHKGGIIAGHDYTKRTKSDRATCHVVEVVNAYTQAHHISPWFILGTRDRVSGETRDKSRSWMWIKD